MIEEIFIIIVGIFVVITGIAAGLKFKRKRYAELLIIGLVFTFIYTYLTCGFINNAELVEAIYGVIGFAFLSLSIFLAIEKEIFNPKWLSVTVCVVFGIVYTFLSLIGQNFF
ncbi:hypothetical protein KYB31_15000 [Clostridium felsineum]|uniref:hypothetical protein n=1 Tax=Clostridium felsineum TaxID=36839 RepID=UPI00098C361C|nr:hypothetical protein [Clostridium felsineum]MCR3760285.1 hypothetical protein [Clostridium felsineum]URZ04253.1 hypothetical protein CLAUR_043410 [Clostridium felsineum]URZ17229.1 hypothetical protein CLFE_032820 [Clostridium felsineum DSM 794]